MGETWHAHSFVLWCDSNHGNAGIFSTNCLSVHETVHTVHAPVYWVFTTQEYLTVNISGSLHYLILQENLIIIELSGLYEHSCDYKKESQVQNHLDYLVCSYLLTQKRKRNEGQTPSRCRAEIFNCPCKIKASTSSQTAPVPVSLNPSGGFVWQILRGCLVSLCTQGFEMMLVQLCSS